MNRSLREIFEAREQRFRLLDEGAEAALWGAGQQLLEIGCASGEAAAHLAERLDVHITGVDADGGVLEAARRLAPARGRCRFLQARAEALPFEDGSFDGMYCEAAFSPLEDQEGAAAEYARVLKPGALLLLNDFILRQDIPEEARRDTGGIPCLGGVGTMDAYIALFRRFGFLLVSRREVFSALARVALELSRACGTSPGELGRCLVRQLPGAENRDPPVFFQTARMSYCQILLRNSGSRREEGKERCP